MKKPCTEQIKNSQIKGVREKMLEAQGFTCPLCEEEILPDEATLDHCYETGHVRAVLHRSCNGAEGRILKWAGHMSKGTDPILWVKNLGKYWETDWSHNVIHPKHGKPKPKRKRRTRMKKPRSSRH